MAIRVVGKRFEYILEADRDDPLPTVFYIRELNARERREIASIFLRITELNEKPSVAEIDAKNNEINNAHMEVCKKTYTEAAPILDCEGTPTNLEIGQVLNGLRSDAQIKELALAAIAANQLSAGDKKKSSTQPVPERQG